MLKLTSLLRSRCNLISQNAGLQTTCSLSLKKEDLPFINSVKHKTKIRVVSRWRKAGKMPVNLPPLPEVPRTDHRLTGKEPEIPKLFVVTRLKPLKNRPWWEKDILIKLGLEDDVSDQVVVKNVPHVNEMLWKVKHMIQVLPVNFVSGEPPRDGDVWKTKLTEYGDFIIPESIEPLPDAVVELNPEFEKKKMDSHTIKTRYHEQWFNPWL